MSLSKRFWTKHEDRVVFWSGSFIIGAILVIVGVLIYFLIEPAKELGIATIGGGLGRISGLGDLMSNKGRSPEKDDESDDNRA